jgi:hypothetical protein
VIRSPALAPAKQAVDDIEAAVLDPKAEIEVAVPADDKAAERREHIEKITKQKSAVALLIDQVERVSADGPDQQDMRDLFNLLAAIERKLRDNADIGEMTKMFAARLAENERLKTAWAYYRTDRQKKERAEEEERQRLERERRRSLARQAAIGFRDRYPAGPASQNHVGTVVAGLVDVTLPLPGKRYWLGTSGVDNHKIQQEPVMADLLKGVKQLEDWPVTACAEVDVMKQYIVAMGITDKARIDGSVLFFHAETWDETQKRWKARTACGNCSQWISAIGAEHGG